MLLDNDTITLKLTADIFRNASYYLGYGKGHRDPIEIALERLNGGTLKETHNYSIGVYAITFLTKDTNRPSFYTPLKRYKISLSDNIFSGYTYEAFLADRAVANLNDFSPSVVVRKLELINIEF